MMKLSHQPLPSPKSSLSHNPVYLDFPGGAPEWFQIAEQQNPLDWSVDNSVRELRGRIEQLQQSNSQEQANYQHKIAALEIGLCAALAIGVVIGVTLNRLYDLKNNEALQAQRRAEIQKRWIAEMEREKKSASEESLLDAKNKSDKIDYLDLIRPPTWQEVLRLKKQLSDGWKQESNYDKSDAKSVLDMSSLAGLRRMIKRKITWKRVLDRRAKAKEKEKGKGGLNNQRHTEPLPKQRK
jgi:hypothetical protein